MAQKTQLTLKQVLFILLIFFLMIFYALYQGAVENKRKEISDLQKQIQTLRSRHIQITRSMQFMHLEGQVQQQIQKRGLNLIKNDIPKVIYVEPVNKTAK